MSIFMAIRSLAGPAAIVFVCCRCRHSLGLNRMVVLALDDVAVKAVRCALRTQGNQLAMEGLFISGHRIIQLMALVKFRILVALGADIDNFLGKAGLLQA